MQALTRAWWECCQGGRRQLAAHTHAEVVQQVYDGQLAAHHALLKQSLEVLRSLPAQQPTPEVAVML